MPDDETRVIEVALPDWLQALRPVVGTLIAFGRNPVGFIITAVATWLVAGALSVGSVLVAGADYAGTLLAAAPQSVQAFLASAFAPVAQTLVGLAGQATASIGAVLATAGPAAPVLVAVFAAVVAVVLYRVGVALLGELPGGSSLVDILDFR